MESYNEGTTTYHTCTFLSKDNEPITPETLEYRLMAGGQVVIEDWTEITPVTTNPTIEISSDSNIIGDYGIERFLTVKATHSNGRVITQELAYTLNDLKGIPRKVVVDP